MFPICRNKIEELMITHFVHRIKCPEGIKFVNGENIDEINEMRTLFGLKPLLP